MAKAAKKKPTKKAKTSEKKSNGKMPDARRDNKTGAAYDQSPYESYAYPLSHPEHQAVVAKLFGLTPPKLEKARILELGCASGGNILPLAIGFPKAEFFGIDLSPVQIQEANTHKENLGLDNVSFEAMDIMDFGADQGKFDYIVCHGVFSWVPDFVREKILDICKNNLTKNGLACVSWNVMPGWAPLRSIREMMMIHTKKYDDPAKKIEQAKLLVEFLARFMPQGSSMQKAVQGVHERFQANPNDSYVFHEYLEDNNEQFYFIEFAEMLEPHKLLYVGDSKLNLMYTGNFGVEVDQALSKVQDTITKEQYIDFLSNRQFRYSILTHQNNAIEGADLNVIDDLLYYCDLVQESSGDDGKLRFVRPNTDYSIETAEPISRTLFSKLTATRYKTYSFSEIVDLVVEELGESNRAGIEKQLRGNMILYMFKDALQPKLTPVKSTSKVSAKPKAHPLSIYQAKLPNCAHVINTHYAQTRLNPLEIVLLRHLDGTRNMDQLVDALLEGVKNGEVSLNQNNIPVIDPQQQRSILKEITPNMLESFKKSNLLIK